ncbi:MAG: metal-dependent transcriptional regulator, partial [Planctomycetota bacterium]
MAINVVKNLSASLEDYLEAIYHLTEGQDVARSKDIAEAMKVSRASV